MSRPLVPVAIDIATWRNGYIAAIRPDIEPWAQAIRAVAQLNAWMRKEEMPAPARALLDGGWQFGTMRVQQLGKRRFALRRIDI
jgi:hypothetical protein